MAATAKDIRKRVDASTTGRTLTIKVRPYKNGWVNVNGRPMKGPVAWAHAHAVIGQMVAEFAHRNTRD